MTNPQDDLSHIADPGSMSPDTMTEPDTGNPGDLDTDHEDLATGDHAPAVPGRSPDSPADQGSPVGPPD
ncbi:hypothetical protein [Catenuloplanes atrovinosus]|uniref:Uncharacterized protein n=1 Tax=Catenuloplanes atrovinosus TaxID=137266 RepID=A0AAE4CCJ2_9ACTN|nr:hypothetical protein [Catenuloplanes atrovinosus]MDR7278024.1 hypothetical protein [Catenuloplanes atrovinosus]